jgi:hypothetical protein
MSSRRFFSTVRSRGEGEWSARHSSVAFDCTLLQEADVDTMRRKIIWADENRLSPLPSRRSVIAPPCPNLSPTLIEEPMIRGPEMEFAPADSSIHFSVRSSSPNYREE